MQRSKGNHDPTPYKGARAHHQSVAALLPSPEERSRGILPTYSMLLTITNAIYIFSMLLAESHLRPTFGPTKTADLTLQSLGTGLQSSKGRLPYN